MSRKKLAPGMEDMRRIVRYDARNAKSKNCILASMDKCTRQCETKASKSLRKLMARHEGYARGPKHLSAKQGEDRLYAEREEGETQESEVKI